MSSLFQGFPRLWAAGIIVPLMVAAPSFAAEPPPLATYGELPAVEQMAMSPSGAGLAIIARIKGQRQIVVFDANRQPRVTMPVGEAKVRQLNWGDESHVVVLQTETKDLPVDFNRDKAEVAGALVLSLDGSKPAQVFSDTPAMAHAVFGDFGFRTVKGHSFGYYGGIALVANADRTRFEFVGGQHGLYSVDLASMDHHRLANPPGEGHAREWAIDGQGQVAATLDFTTDTGNWTLMGAGGIELARGVEKFGRLGLVGLGHDLATAVLQSYQSADGKRHWYEVPLAGGAMTEILKDENVQRVYFDPLDGRMVGYLAATSDGGTLPVLYDAARQDRLRKIYRAFPGRRVSIMDFSPDFSHVLVRTSGNGDPGTWFKVDLINLKAEPVGDERPAIPSAMVGMVRTFDYKASDGTALRGILTLPPNREPRQLPVVMLPHGGPNARDEVQFDWWAQALASRGYAVFQPNFRGSTDRDEAFVEAGDGQWGRKMQTDISDGLAELAKLGIVDPRRACIAGASYGGYAAPAGVTLQRGFYRCAIAVAPVSDIGDIYYTDMRQTDYDELTKRRLKQSFGDPTTFDAVSPRRHAADADAPILLIHGKDDTVVPFRHSDRMAAALRDAHKPVDFVVLQKEDHWLSRSETRRQMLEACVAFALKHNPPD